MSNLRTTVNASETVGLDWIHGNPLAIWIFDQETFRFIAVNQRALDLYEYSRAEFLMLRVQDLSQHKLFESNVLTIRASESDWTGDLVHKTSGGNTIDVRVNANMFFHEDRPHQLGIVENLTERVVREASLLRLAQQDPLTGLPNRAIFAEKLTGAIDNAKQNGRKMAVACIDLDRFKQVNDWYGHSVGDGCLKQLGDRLVRTLRGMDVVARTGGEEFNVILSELKDAHSADAVAKTLLNTFDTPFLVEGNVIRLSGSVGVAVYPVHGDNADDLTKAADAAMYRAKRNGGNRHVLAGPVQKAKAVSSETIHSYVKRMILADQCEMHYQPQFGLDGLVRGAEALIRLPDERGGHINPDLFIPQAEESGLIHQIGQWTLNQACKQIATWKKQGHPEVTVAINVSPLQLLHKDFISEVESCIRAWQVDPKHLEMEITERVALNFEEVGKRMQTLHKLGIRFAVDDFGVGYSSLQHLYRLPISTVKIDRSFVQHICEPGGTHRLIEAIVAMAHSLDMKVVAEGVESQSQLRKLADLNCDGVQGFLLSRPITADGLTKLFSRVQESEG